jgi:hypothetical protein
VTITTRFDGALAVMQARVAWRRDEEGASAVGLTFVKLREDHEALVQRVVISGTSR